MVPEQGEKIPAVESNLVDLLKTVMKYSIEVLEYYHVMLLYTFNPLHFRRKCCTFLHSIYLTALVTFNMKSKTTEKVKNRKQIHVFELFFFPLLLITS